MEIIETIPEIEESISVDHSRIFERVGCNTYLKVDLEAIAHNVDWIRGKCPLRTGIIAVVSNGASGLGSVIISRHLRSLGVERLGVQTLREGVHLRRNGIRGPIMVFENALPEQAASYFNYDLVPTVSSPPFLPIWRQLHDTRLEEAIQAREAATPPGSCSEDESARDNSLEKGTDWLPPKKICVEVDTGIVRTGLDWQKLDDFMKECEDCGVMVDSIYTHLVEGAVQTEQLKHFKLISGKYRRGGTSLHVADSKALLSGLGTDLDFVRVGSAIYGCTTERERNGLIPAVSWVAAPIDATNNEWTFSVGREDGFHGQYVKFNNGETAPVPKLTKTTTVVSPPNDVTQTVCRLMTSDLDPMTSCFALSLQGSKRPIDVISSIAARVPRVYFDKSDWFTQLDMLQTGAKMFY